MSWHDNEPRYRRPGQDAVSATYFHGISLLEDGPLYLCDASFIHLEARATNALPQFLTVSIESVVRP